jgi:hypothetical protein
MVEGIVVCRKKGGNAVDVIAEDRSQKAASPRERRKTALAIYRISPRAKNRKRNG